MEAVTEIERLEVTLVALKPIIIPEQGFPAAAAENNFGYSLAGASLGMPFINSTFYGSSHGNRAVGSYACSPQIYNHFR